MKFKRIKIFSLLSLVCIFSLFWLLANSYSTNNTHPTLTGEIAKFFNAKNQGHQISQEEINWLEQGSIEEDEPPRYINHFYDPIHKTGWSGKHFGNLSQEQGYKEGSDMAPRPAIASIDWAVNQEYQSAYGRQYGNQTWQKAVKTYLDGDKKSAFIALGHVLHLIEDASVPDHTRDDTHAGIYGDPGSPYEDYAKNYTNFNELSAANDLIKQNNGLVSFQDLPEAFNYLANYSNNNFFSEDTINNDDFKNPTLNKLDKITEIIKGDKILFLKNGNDYLAFLDPTNNFSTNDEDLVLPSYRSRLFPKAVLIGASVIDLFFKETEKYKQHQESLEPIIPDSSEPILQTLLHSPKIFALKTVNLIDNGVTQAKIFAVGLNTAIQNFVANISNTLTSSTQPASVLQSEEQPGQQPIPASSPLSPAPAPAPSQEITPPPSAPAASVVKHPVSNIVEDIADVRLPMSNASPEPVKNSVSDIPLPRPLVPSLPYPGFGGGGSAPASQISSQPQPDTTPPNAPIVISPADFSQTFTSAGISFSGAAEASSVISTDFSAATTTADSNGDWSLNLSLNQGSSTIKFFASDAGGNISTSTGISLFVDSIAPTIDSFSISECLSSLSPDACLAATTTIHLSWQSSAGDLEYFELTSNGQVSTTTATSTTISVSDNSTNTFSLRVKDKSGNWSAGQTASAEISLMPVVINEVAWSGTGPEHPEDEWIELYNRASRTINLTDWALYSQTDLGPYIPLAGSIPSKGYYLIERTDDNTVSDILADWKGSFASGLNNAGEILALVYAPAGGQATTTIDQTALCGLGSVQWCPGFDYKYRSMERYDPDISGTDQNNWGTNNGIITNGKNADNQAINATPKARNSVNYLINKNGDISSDLTLKKANSPYLVDNRTITINAAATLTIEPGVTIKFYNDAGMNVFGKITASGTANDPIVFTPFADGNYWYGVNIYADGSVFDYVNFRYGGKYYDGMGQSKASLNAENASMQIANSVFESAKVYGLKLSNSNSTISGSTFRNNNASGENNALGMLIESSGNVNLQSNTFLDNRNNLYISNSTTTIKDSTFRNSGTAITYSHSPIRLENVKLEGNNLGLLADSWSASQSISALLVEFLNNLATTSPGGLW